MVFVYLLLSSSYALKISGSVTVLRMKTNNVVARFFIQDTVNKSSELTVRAFIEKPFSIGVYV